MYNLYVKVVPYMLVTLNSTLADKPEADSKTGHLEKCKGAIPYFWAKNAPDHTILAKLRFMNCSPKIHYLTLLGQNCTSLQQNCTFSKFFPHFSRCPGKVILPSALSINAPLYEKSKQGCIQSPGIKIGTSCKQ